MKHQSNLLFVAIFVVFMIGLLVLITALQPSTPSIEVTQLSINPKSVSNEGLATITCSTTSNDRNATHQITVQMSIEPTELVTFSVAYPNTLTLTQISSTVWQDSYIQNPLSSYSQKINAQVGSLPSGYLNSDYIITVTVFMDGKQIKNQTLELIVTQ